MTSISTSLTENTGKNRPFLLSPAGKDYLWGGRRLKDDYSKNIDLDPLAETWECSTHPDGPSIVASGPYKGMSLSDVLKKHPEYLGTHAESLVDSGIPVLIKFIDAKENLSIQVHPDDSYAKVHENGSLGKTEMWYVLDAEEGSKLVYGFRTDVNKDLIRRSIQNGTIERYLQYVPVHKGDVFFITPGTVHAIGAGIVLAEIQESSNITYRLYDYNRIGKDGKLRQLHIDQALDVVNMKSSAEPRQPMRKLQYKPGYASEMIGRCKYFETERVIINTERTRSLASIQTRPETFNVLLCTDGCASLFGEGEYLNIFKGDCVFIPANCIRLKLHGKAEFLRVRC